MPPGLAQQAASASSEQILTPPSPSQAVDPFAPPCRKRKRRDIEDEVDLGCTFIIHLDPSSSNDEQLKLTPQLLLSRDHLCLAYLQLARHASQDDHPRLFSAYIHALESPDSLEQYHQERSLLIAKRDDDPSTYAVERMRRGMYWLCKLNQWVPLDELRSLSAKSSRLQPVNNVHGGKHWWSSAVTEVREESTKGHNLALDLEKNESQQLLNHQLSVAQKLRQPFEHMLPVHDVGGDQVLSARHGYFGVQNGDTNDCPTNSENIVAMIKCHYLEALYATKTSLAYFAKGPLSRARAAMHQHASGSLKTVELIQSLRAHIISLPANDRKYCETLPNIIKELPMGLNNDDDNAVTMSLLEDKFRKPKKKKLGKDGLFPGEEIYLIRWWVNRDKSLDTHLHSNKIDDVIKVLLVEQRARETQLQIILILEVFALEALQIQGGGADNEVEAQQDNIGARKSGKTATKQQNLEKILDVFVDRLCIWQSTSQDEDGLIGDAQRAGWHQNEEMELVSNINRLRAFCTEVVVPFYATRLPNLYVSLCRKLGAPVVPSPAPVPLQNQTSSLKRDCNSGTSLHGSHVFKPCKPHERMPGKQKPTSQRPRSRLTRSATDSIIPGIKRELSDATLSAISTTRLNLQHPRRYSYREVDLSAAAQATEAKQQKKSVIEQELKNAIAALTKPNPRAAAREVVDSAERRTAGAEARSRKSKNPKRNPFGQGIQVMATPKRNRRKEVDFDLPRPCNDIIEQQEPETIPPSSNPCIPSSSIRPLALPASPSTILATVKQTPSRHPSKLTRSFSCSAVSMEGDQDNRSQPVTYHLISKQRLTTFKQSTLPDQGIRHPPHSLSHLELDTPSRKPHTRINFIEPQGRTKLQPILTTPLKDRVRHMYKVNVESNLKEVPSFSDPTSEKKSIYETLGWNNDEFNDLT